MAWKDILDSLRATKRKAACDPADPTPRAHPAPDNPASGDAESTNASPPNDLPPSPAPIHGLAKRKKGDSAKDAQALVQAECGDTAYQQKSYYVEYIEREYQPYGEQIAATVLVHALQHGGLQRLLERLGLTPWKNDHLDHEELQKFLREQGSAVFCQKMGLKTPTATASGDPESPPPPATDDEIPRPRRIPSASKPGASSKEAEAKIHPDGEHFQPIRIESNALRRGALGRRPGDPPTPEDPPPRDHAPEHDEDLDLPWAEPFSDKTASPQPVPIPVSALRRSGKSALRPASPDPATAPTTAASPDDTKSAQRGGTLSPSQPKPTASPDAQQGPSSPSRSDAPAVERPFQALWRKPAEAGNDETRGDARPRGPVPRTTDRPGQTSTPNTVANEFLRKMIDKHTRSFASPPDPETNQDNPS